MGNRVIPAPVAYADPIRPSQDLLGHVAAIGGSSATIRLTTSPLSGVAVAPITIGNFLGIQTGVSRVVAVITYVDGGDKAAGEQQRGLIAKADLLGEIRARDNGSVMFQRGITGYPVMGDRVQLLGSEGLRMVYDTAGADTINIGQLQQDSSIGAYVKVDEMLRKHFALFGTTGVGKSSGVAVILRAILERGQTCASS